jgi:hypothetical protein
MPFSFPSSPSVGATSTQNGRQYVYAGNNVWELVAASGGGSGSVTLPGLGDPFAGNVSLLAHMDGTGGTFVDSSGTPKTITAVGNATQSATQSKFGGKSLQCPAGGYLSVNGGSGGSDFLFGETGNFTIELWAYPTQTPDGSALFTSEYASTVGMTIAFSNSNTLGSVSGSTLFTGFFASGAWRGIATNTSLPLNQWSHIAVCRLNGTYSLYLNGTRLGNMTSSYSIPSTQTIWIGKDWGSSTSSIGSFVGFIDEVRVTKGVARYSGDSLVVPTAAGANGVDLTVPVVFA